MSVKEDKENVTMTKYFVTKSLLYKTVFITLSFVSIKKVFRMRTSCTRKTSPLFRFLSTMTNVF